MFIEIYKHSSVCLVRARTKQTIGTDHGICMYLYSYGNVPTYLLAMHVHGPRFTTPKCARAQDVVLNIVGCRGVVKLRV